VSAIEVSDLSVHYGQVHALYGQDLSLETPQVNGVVGTNGFRPSSDR
jgi:manganese transport system ATP-binding protein